MDAINDYKESIEKVEKRLRAHVKKKKGTRRKLIFLIQVCIFLIIPVSVLAACNVFKSPVQLTIEKAMDNKSYSDINYHFKYKGVDFNFKKVIADENSMLLTYEVSDPNYSISEISINGEDDKYIDFLSSGARDSLNASTSKTYSFELKPKTAEYMKNHAVKFKIEELYVKNNLLSNILGNKGVKIKDSYFTLNVPISEDKIININKGFDLGIGKLLIKDMQMGAVKTIINYEMLPVIKDSNLKKIKPNLYVIINNKAYSCDCFPYNNRAELYNSGILDNIDTFQIGVASASEIRYLKEPISISVKKGDTPKIIDIEETQITSNSIKYSMGKTSLDISIDKNNRTFDDIIVGFTALNNENSKGNEGTDFKYDIVDYKDIRDREAAYTKLCSIVPDLVNLNNTSNAYNKGLVGFKVSAKGNQQKLDFQIMGTITNRFFDVEPIDIKPQ